MPRELAARHPVRERFHGQLMEALARAGRRAEALEAYRQARRVLVEELRGQELSLRDIAGRLVIATGRRKASIPRRPP